MKLIWTQVAHVDREKIREYISQDNPSAALKFDQLLSEKVEKLVKFPTLGRLGRIVNTRELIVNPNYIMIYDISNGVVRILRVLHTKKKFP
ncbi:type II toxin-antitoxin system RelE/ParE family toxin [Bartonella krasnovii]|uniref:Type II toxin-antitoxin system RelE/ParE family toxin n=1 Tax=Bartonella krasnovii TaxID=2267275 RepID=A0A5B9D068_9HYPH|nr:type II toxin-antitoxin system RelE/ParE family toxin [Bartonella krasnovii]QEE11953.1 type II toxin-antitoxin system RelE/ParE family toxin [Bartonella krasnovii]UNF42769.1 type II toxin-antitoxin system RelE/ParE family toxin [Bartonella krasnovii]UNF54266.1 type II toxin-antitoxin system RelE/ParE family toxin [Bartonella krasnovii]UNF55979.1 type II toxin-antitoxin system RelE/ParE family toxin [Bartonella krasnovii]